MGILSNSNKEKFCLSYIKFDCDRARWKEMFEDCGYKINRGYFSKLTKMPDVQGRILELQQEAANNEVLGLRDRLKMLSDIAKDESQSTAQRISALNSIHKQSGDDAVQVTADENTKVSSVVRFVDVKLPPKRINQAEVKEDEASNQEDAGSIYCSKEGRVVSSPDEKLAVELDKLDEMHG